MCGIIGYTGINEAVKKVTQGLEVLEYRGYDSVGICASVGGKLEIVKTKGKMTFVPLDIQDGQHTVRHLM